MKVRAASGHSVQRIGRNRKPASEGVRRVPFRIVGIGASAGGLESVAKFLYELPSTTGMVLVFIQHHDLKNETSLTSLLSSSTSMPVRQVTGSISLKPNHVYVAPSNMNVQIRNSTVRLTRRVDRNNGLDGPMPVGGFFHSLAASQKSGAIGVALSGADSACTAGLKQIKRVGGLTFAQGPGSASLDGMPSKAIAAGVVDFVLPPEEIARELAQIATARRG